MSSQKESLMKSKRFDTPGTYSFNPPGDAEYVTIRGLGGGGGGGAGANAAVTGAGPADDNGGGGGGGAGAMPITQPRGPLDHEKNYMIIGGAGGPGGRRGSGAG